MTAQHKGKVFKAGNSAAVRLPKDVAFALGTEIVIERVGNTVTIKPQEDRDAVRRDLHAMFEEIDDIWARHDGPPAPPIVRDQDIFPDRLGLY